jgi:hypothetical protein
VSFGALERLRPVSTDHPFPWRTGALFLAPLLAIGGVGAASGGFFPTSFGWTGVIFAWAILVAMSLVAPRWGTLDVVWLAGAGALCVYTFISAAWAASTGDAVNEGLRSLVYLLGIAGALVLLRARDVERWLGGLVLGVAGVCLYSLASRLLPTHFGGFNSTEYRLYVPIGYWNALGIFAAVALLVALGVAALGRGGVLRFCSALSAVVLTPTLYFTFSRGAWFALVSGTVVMLVLSPRRMRLICALGLFGAVPAICVLIASRSPALIVAGATIAAASHAGHRVALEFALLALAQAAVAVVYLRLLSPLAVSARVRQAFGVAILAASLAALAAVLDHYGSPATIARHAYDSFVSAPSGGADLNGRLFSFSNNGRIVLWHAAWRDFTTHPVFGSGAGSYGAWWLAHRTSSAFVEDAHNLYLQTLGELGIVGFLLLVWLLGVPLLAALRARRVPLVAPALGAYVAFLVHAAIDWDWEMPAVTLLALFTGAAIVAASRRADPAPRTMRRPFRIAIGVGALIAAGLAFVGLIGNIALARSGAAALAGNGTKAVAEASVARTWAPWSAQALIDLGQGRVLAGSRRSGLEAFREAARKDPGDWEVWFDIAAATSGEAHRAALARARALNPESPEIAAVVASGAGG